MSEHVPEAGRRKSQEIVAFVAILVAGVILIAVAGVQPHAFTAYAAAFGALYETWSTATASRRVSAPVL
ncbi:hypothetical protein [Streptomyces sp. NBC_01236]|uniref:hypothetical protein n=1 Tax=Streptomyces sp. NBC_01236 TaxID=2903789 RepID=UPI002E0F361E|nr:hypothetical protein OG324_13940 [Streptomyces sp. NBC_01236]